MNNLNQRGILNILVLLVVIAGIALGSYYIRQQTQPGQKVSAAGTVACDGQTLASQSAETQSAFNTAYPGNAATEWVIHHEQELADKGTPCGSGKTEGAGCTLSDSTSISSACANEIDSKNPGFMASIEGSDKNTCTRAQIISHWCAGNASDCATKRQAATSCGGSGASNPTGAGSASCPVPSANPSQTVDETYKQAKVMNNLVRYCAIITGVASYCTPADLGVDPVKNADAVGGGSGRLLLCSGADSKKGDLKLVWNVIVGNSIKVSSKPMNGEVVTELNIKEAVTAVGLNPNEFTCN